MIVYRRVPTPHGSIAPTNVPMADNLAQEWQKIHNKVKAKRSMAKEVQQQFCKSGALQDFEPGDLVWLSSNIFFQCLSKKLDWKQLGPYKVLEKIFSHAYQWELQTTMKVHNVFHTIYFLPYLEDKESGCMFD